MAEQREFPALRRRLRELQRMIAEVESNMAPGSLEASVGSTTVYMLGQFNEEANEIDFILRYYQRTNGALGRMQWMLVVISMAVSSALLILLFVQRWLP